MSHNILQIRYRVYCFIELCKIQILTIMLHMCSLLNYGFVNVFDTCVFCIVLFLLVKLCSCTVMPIKVLNLESWYEWSFQCVRPSVHLSVCLSVHHTFFTMFPSLYHPEIFELLPMTDVMSMQRSRSEVMTPLSHFRTVTPVLIHIWRWNDAQNLMLLRRGALLFFKVIRQISRSHG